MQTVFLMSDIYDNTYFDIISILRQFKFSIIDSTHVHVFHSNRLAVEISGCLDIRTTKSTLLVLNKEQLPKISVRGAIKGICESSNHNALNVLKNNEIPAIVCGMSKTDTITFSSITNDKALISIQRRIKTNNGKILEPCEISIKLNHKYSNSAVICACSILLLNDISFTEI